MKREYYQGFLFLLTALFIGSLLIPIGLIYTVGKYIKEWKWRETWKLFRDLFLSILITFSWICERIAVGIDILGNVAAGEFLEDCITSREDTLFSKPGITISASTGELESRDELNKTGKWFSNMLSKVFEDNHSLLAYLHYWELRKLNHRIEGLDKEEIKKIFNDEV